MKKSVSFFSGYLLAVFSPCVLAGASIGDISHELLGPLSGLAKVIYALSIVAGLSFFIGGIVQYKYHRENPQNVRLSKPITLWIIGLALMVLPLIAMHSESSYYLR